MLEKGLIAALVAVVIVSSVGHVGCQLRTPFERIALAFQPHASAAVEVCK